MKLLTIKFKNIFLKYKYWVMRIKHISLLFLISYLVYSYNPLANKEDCIFLYGGGYSGYWYTLSQLRQYYYQLDQKFICYSSACLSLVYMLQKPNFSNIVKKSDKMQQQLIKSNSNLTEMRNAYIDVVIDNRIDISKYNFEILTTNKYGKCDFNKPTNHTHLRKLLIETTFVPGITGTYDEKNDNYDGGMCVGKRKCQREITIPHNYRMWLKTFCPYLDEDDKKYFMSL